MRLIWTDAGHAALVNAKNNGTNSVLCQYIAIGSGTTPASADDTALEDEIKRVDTIAGQAVDDNIIHAVMRDESSDAYAAYEVGLISDENVLLARYAQADAILEKAAPSTGLLTVDSIFTDVDVTQVVFPSVEFVNPPWGTETQGVVQKATEALAKSGTDNLRGMTARLVFAAIKSYFGGATGAGAGRGLDADTVRGLVPDAMTNRTNDWEQYQRIQSGLGCYQGKPIDRPHEGNGDFIVRLAEISKNSTQIAGRFTQCADDSSNHGALMIDVVASDTYVAARITGAAYYKSADYATPITFDHDGRRWSGLRLGFDDYRWHFTFDGYAEAIDDIIALRESHVTNIDDAARGNHNFRGSIQVDGFTAWHAGNLDPQEQRQRISFDTHTVDDNAAALGAQPYGWYTWGAHTPSDFPDDELQYSSAVLVGRSDGTPRFLIFRNNSADIYSGFVRDGQAQGIHRMLTDNDYHPLRQGVSFDTQSVDNNAAALGEQPYGWYTWGAHTPSDFDGDDLAYSSAVLVGRTDGTPRTLIFRNNSSDLYTAYISGGQVRDLEKILTAAGGDTIGGRTTFSAKVPLQFEGPAGPDQDVFLDGPGGEPMIRLYRRSSGDYLLQIGADRDDALTTGSTTVDSNGFIKEASPALRLSDTGIDPNSKATGMASFAKIDTGVYRVSTPAGFAKSGWYIETPKSANGNIKVFVDYDEEADGTINVRTYTPDYSAGYAAAGEPVDIPAGRWIDLRLAEAEGEV